MNDSSSADFTAPSLLYLVKQLELAVRGRLDQIVRPRGLTSVQFTALTVLARHEDLTAAQLARRSFVSSQSMADMVDALSSRGLIQRHRDSTDRQRLVISLTDDGRRLIRDLRPHVDDVESDMVAALSPTAAEELRAAVVLCREALDASYDGAVA